MDTQKQHNKDLLDRICDVDGPWAKKITIGAVIATTLAFMGISYELGSTNNTPTHAEVKDVNSDGRNDILVETSRGDHRTFLGQLDGSYKLFEKMKLVPHATPKGKMYGIEIEHEYK